MKNLDLIPSFRVTAMVKGAARSYGVAAPCARVAAAEVISALRSKGIAATVLRTARV